MSPYSKKKDNPQKDKDKRWEIDDKTFQHFSFSSDADDSSKNLMIHSKYD